MFTRCEYFLIGSKMSYVRIFGSITIWITLSSSIILSNKYIIHELQFPVVTLVTLHQATTLFLSEVWCKIQETNRPKIDFKENIQSFFVVAVLFAVNLGFSNAAYIYLNVALIQMIKAITPVFVLLASFAFGIEKFTIQINTIIVLIVAGVCTSSIHDIEFGSKHSTIGYVLQGTAIVAEAVRLSVAKILLNSYNISPVASLTMIGRNALPILLVVWCGTDMMDLFNSNFEVFGRVNIFILIANCSIAFLLNCASMLLIEMTSPLTLNVCGIAKDFILVAWSVLISHNVINSIQYLGFMISSMGVALYVRYKHRQSAAAKEVNVQATYVLLQTEESDEDNPS